MSAITPEELQAVLDAFIGGSEGRYRHHFNLRFIYTEGVKIMAEKAGAFWLLDTVALYVAPICLDRWDRLGDSPHFLKIEVKDHHAKIELVRDGGEPALWMDIVEFTDFPEGKWTFELAMDGLVDPDFDVLVMLLPQEH